MLYLFVLGRILFGGFFIMSGLKHFKHLKNFTGYAQSKGVPMPREGVMFSGLMIIAGGLGIILGVYIQLSVLLISVFLAIISMQMHQYWKETDAMGRMADEVNFKKNMALLGAALIFLAVPASLWVYPFLM